MVSRLFDTQPGLSAPMIALTKLANVWTLASFGTQAQDHAGADYQLVDFRIEIWTGKNGTGSMVASNTGKLPLGVGLFVAAIGQTYYARANGRTAAGMVSPWSADAIITG